MPMQYRNLVQGFAHFAVCELSRVLLFVSYRAVVMSCLYLSVLCWRTSPLKHAFPYRVKRNMNPRCRRVEAARAAAADAYYSQFSFRPRLCSRSLQLARQVSAPATPCAGTAALCIEKCVRERLLMEAAGHSAARASSAEVAEWELNSLILWRATTLPSTFLNMYCINLQVYIARLVGHGD